jgi:SAM-dependent methyltransferase
MESRKQHWETVYETKTPEQVSWTQEKPEGSLKFIHDLGLDKDASIIDIGGGDSKLVDFLLADGYSDVTVLDISGKAIERAKNRLGINADKVTWIESDINDFVPSRTFSIWHDRAAFHFLTSTEEQERYVKLVNSSVTDFLVIGTFSEDGPLKCSGLEIQQYSELSMVDQFKGFEKIKCENEKHLTPFDTIQNFIFCSFKKLG